MPRRYVSRATRKKLVVAAVTKLTRDEGYDSVSSVDIARELSLVPSTYLREILYDLVRQQVLHIRWVKHRTNVQAARYTLSRQWITSREATQQQLL